MDSCSSSNLSASKADSRTFALSSGYVDGHPLIRCTASPPRKRNADSQPHCCSMDSETIYCTCDVSLQLHHHSGPTLGLLESSIKYDLDPEMFEPLLSTKKRPAGNKKKENSRWQRLLPRRPSLKRRDGRAETLDDEDQAWALK